jgi:hypothetical protein
MHHARCTTFHHPEPGCRIRSGPVPTPAPANAVVAPAPQGQQDNGGDRQAQPADRTYPRGRRWQPCDETRVGGQTQSITVQPKVGSMPEYEVQSNDGARAARNRDNNSGDTTGTRVWNFIKF